MGMDVPDGLTHFTTAPALYFLSLTGLHSSEECLEYVKLCRSLLLPEMFPSQDLRL